MVFSGEETFAPASRARTKKNFRPQSAKKARCSSTAADGEHVLFPCFFFPPSLSKTTQAHNPLSIFIFTSRNIQVVLEARARNSSSPRQASNVAVRDGCWRCGSAGGSPLVGPLLGGVVRSDHLGLRHHSVLVLREGVAIWERNESGHR